MRSSRSRSWVLWALVALPLLALGVAAQGPDVIVGDLSDFGSYGTIGGISAYSIGTTSCNIGNQPLNWQANTPNHPVIAQNLYRIRNDRFEQVGMSWLKHGFTALAQSLCNSCQNPGTGTLLGVGCSDPYVASLNGSQSGLGPRSEVNAASGLFPMPFGGAPVASLLSRRLQVNNTDLNPTLNAGAIYLSEGQYIAADDAAAGNDNNNASYRRTNVTGQSAPHALSFAASTVRQKAAIEGWRDIDSSVQLSYFDVLNDGRFIVATKTIALGGGFNRYEFAVHNLNSYRSGASFTVNFPAATQYNSNANSPYFHDIAHHSGEPYNSTDWQFVQGSNGIVWQCTETHAQNPNANALRWATSYNFAIEANQAPTGTSIGLFAPQPCPPQPPIPPTGGYALAQNQTFDFVPVASLTNVGNGPNQDDQSVTATLPFTFGFYGQPLTQIKVSSNGYLCQTNQDGTIYIFASIPSVAPPNGFIAGHWADLNPSAGGLIRYGTSGAAPNRRFVVDYANVPHYFNSGSYSFQIILNENGQTITSTIVSVSLNGSNATRGIEDPTGAGGTQGSFAQPNSAPANSTWVYTPQTGTIPQSAVLTQIGDGAVGTDYGVYLLSQPNKPFILGVGTDPGPLNLGALGIINLNIFSPSFIVIWDGTGFLAPANPLAETDGCGQHSTVFVVPPAGVAWLYGYYAQGYVFSTTAPNGVFHISSQVDFSGI